MQDSIYLLGANASAGFFAAVVWGYFAVVRWNRGRKFLSFVDGIMTGVSAIVGAGYAWFILNPDTPPVWLRWFVLPALALPACLHLTSWMQARRFIAAADPGDPE